jgi:hypothetical protein
VHITASIVSNPPPIHFTPYILNFTYEVDTVGMNKKRTMVKKEGEITVRSKDPH